jgi:hypothetical protein
MRKSENRPDNLNRADRPQRSSIHDVGRDKMSVKGIKPGFHPCWVNDYNVDAFLQAGYDFVTYGVTVGEKQLAAVSEGGKHSIAAGNGVVAYLMEIPEEYYQADLKIIENETSEKERAMFEGLRSKDQGRYGEVKIENRLSLNNS